MTQTTSQQLPTYRILCIDGGGILGVVPITILQRLDEKRPGFIGKANLVAGTSTGGILALGLADGKSPATLLELYTKHGQDIFPKPGWFSWLTSLVRPKYPNEKLKEYTAENLKAKTLNDFSRTHILISSFDLDSADTPPVAQGTSELHGWKAKFFHNFQSDENHGGASTVDVALRTSAAPTYFPTYQGYVDGGVVANNPSVCALAQALAAPDDHGAGQQLGQCVLLSLSCGKSGRYISAGNSSFGLIQWLYQRRIIDLLLEGGVGLADFQCQQLLGNRYRRVDLPLGTVYSVDSVGDVPDIVDHTNAYMDMAVDELVAWLDRYWMPDEV